MQLLQALLLIPFSNAFTINNQKKAIPVSFTKLTSTSIPTDVAIESKNKLKSLALELNEKSPSGVFVFESESKEKLQKAIFELEAVAGAPNGAVYNEKLVGDWTLLCTMNIPKYNKQQQAPSSIVFNVIPDWLKSNPLQEKIRSSVEVTQRIRVTGDEPNAVINRVDNVVEFTPFSIEDILNTENLNLNLLEISKSKVTLAHKAEIQSITPVHRTKISLESIILTVAGTSEYLDPNGADVLGLNVPLGEFLNAGSFDTTYVDEDIRVSRGTLGLFDQLRVFVRKDDIISPEIVEESIDEDVETEGANKQEDEEEIEIVDAVVEDKVEEEDVLEEQQEEVPGKDEDEKKSELEE